MDAITQERDGKSILDLKKEHLDFWGETPNDRWTTASSSTKSIYSINPTQPVTSENNTSTALQDTKKDSPILDALKNRIANNSISKKIFSILKNKKKWA